MELRVTVSDNRNSAENTTPAKKWVRFEDESGSASSAVPGSASVSATKSAPAVIPQESVHLNLSSTSNGSSMPSTPRAVMQNINLGDRSNDSLSSVTNNIQQTFSNGDVIVTLLPVNTRLPWITPATFRPELVPEELMAQGLTLTVEDYVQIMELLTNDVRFAMYNICYKRVLVVWIFTAFAILIGILFSGVQGMTLFTLGIVWLVFNAAAVFVCMWVKMKLNRNLEYCLGNVNRHLLRHKIIVGLDDRGKISCHKVNLCFIYFDTADCLKKLRDVIEREETGQNAIHRVLTKEEDRQKRLFNERMDIDDRDIIIHGSADTRLSRKQERAMLLLLRYCSRWAKLAVRGSLSLSVECGVGHQAHLSPRHCVSCWCPCQFIEQHLRLKPTVLPRVCKPATMTY